MKSMELDKLQNMWQTLDQKLDRNWQLNLSLIRRANLDKAMRKMKGLTWVTSLSLAFYAIVASYFIHLTIQNWTSPFLAGSCGIVAGWSLFITYAAIRELKLILELDYSKPILEVQKQLVQVRLAILRYLRVLVWMLPFSFVFVVLFFKLLFGIDITAEAPLDWILWNIAICLVLFAPLSFWLYKKLNPKHAEEEWIYKFLKGSGSQISDAISFLKEIDTFEGMEKKDMLN